MFLSLIPFLFKMFRMSDPAFFVTVVPSWLVMKNVSVLSVSMNRIVLIMLIIVIVAFSTFSGLKIIDPISESLSEQFKMNSGNFFLPEILYTKNIQAITFARSS